LFALSGPDDIDELLAVSAEMLALDSEPRGWISVEAYSARHSGLLHRGDLRAAEAALAATGEIAVARGFVELRWHHDRQHAQHQLLAGNFATAEAAFARLHRAAVRLHLQTGAAILDMQRAVLAIARHGPVAFAANGCVPSLHDGAQPARAYEFPSYRANAARFALAFGHLEPARRVLEALSAQDFAAVPRDLGYLHTLCNLAFAAIALGDAPRVERLYTLLAPYAQHNTPNVAGLYDGPVAHFLALLAAFLVVQAIECNERLGLRPLLARSCFEYARWLLKTRRHARASVLRQRTIELSDSLGLAWLAQQARALGNS
jgi:hypothetical protein